MLPSSRAKASLCSGVDAVHDRTLPRGEWGTRSIGSLCRGAIFNVPLMPSAAFSSASGREKRAVKVRVTGSSAGASSRRVARRRSACRQRLARNRHCPLRARRFSGRVHCRRPERSGCDAIAHRTAVDARRCARYRQQCRRRSRGSFWQRRPCRVSRPDGVQSAARAATHPSAPASHADGAVRPDRQCHQPGDARVAAARQLYAASKAALESMTRTIARSSRWDMASPPMQSRGPDRDRIVPRRQPRGQRRRSSLSRAGPNEPARRASGNRPHDRLSCFRWGQFCDRADPIRGRRREPWSRVTGSCSRMLSSFLERTKSHCLERPRPAPSLEVRPSLI